MTSTEVANRAWGEHEPEPVALSRGPWSLELRDDELADIRFDGSLILRSIRAVARDRDWGTVPSRVESLTETDSGLSLSVGMRGLGADVDARLEVELDDATLTIAFEATVNGDFRSNRLGLVVLHPPTAAGAALEIESTDGTSTMTAFPVEISPHQPAFDIAALRWTDGGVASTLRFTGETFEMEDQRNWTDASYKTYSTPLALPFPVLIAAGTVLRQTITVSSSRVASVAPATASTTVELARSAGSVPQFTAQASTAPDALPSEVRSPAGALLVELDARTANWHAALDRAVVEAAGRPLDVRLIVAESGQLDPLIAALAERDLARLGVYSAETHVTEPELWDELVRLAAGHKVALVGGARSHFTELNRTHERLPEAIPALTFSMTPQMHATNRYQLVESIAMQRLVAENARRIAGDRPVHVGPVTLRARFNAVATSGGAAAGASDLSEGYGAALVPDASDDRQAAPALAAWTIASAAALSQAGVASVSYFETWGPRGTAGFPVEEAVRWLAEVEGSPRLESSGALPDGIWMLAADPESGPVALLANLTEDDATVEVAYAGVTTTVVVPTLGAVRAELSETR